MSIANKYNKGNIFNFTAPKDFEYHSLHDLFNNNGNIPLADIPTDSNYTINNSEINIGFKYLKINNQIFTNYLVGISNNEFNIK